MNRRWIAGAGCALLIAVLHYFAFYRSLGSHPFNPDALVPFAQEIHSGGDLWHSLMSVDRFFEYRPVPYILFSFLFHPLLGASPAAYHGLAYILGALVTALAGILVYLWSGRRLSVLIPAFLYLAFNPLNLETSSGLEMICEVCSLLFYFGALVLFLKRPLAVWGQAALFALALGSKEHSLVLPAHAFLMLISMGTTWREALRRTRVLWLGMVIFVAFQFDIRGGRLFPSPAESDRLAFDGSLSRFRQLADGSDFLLSIPVRTWLSRELGVHHLARLSCIALWLIAIGAAVKRRDALALAGVVWAGVSLLPVLFISELPMARHYLLALPGVALLLGRAVEHRKLLIASVACAFAICLPININWMLLNGWFATDEGSTGYLSGIRYVAESSNRSEVYATQQSDAGLGYAIGWGASIEQLLGRKIQIELAENGIPLPIARVLHNRVSLITTEGGAVVDALRPGPGSMLSPAKCDVIRTLIAGGDRCAILHYGFELTGPAAQVSIKRSGDRILTTSANTFLVASDSRLSFHKRAVLDRNSKDGVVIELYVRANDQFQRLESKYVAPGGVYEANLDMPGGDDSVAVLRIRRGPEKDGVGDNLEWEPTLHPR